MVDRRRQVDAAACEDALSPSWATRHSPTSCGCSGHRAVACPRGGPGLGTVAAPRRRRGEAHRRRAV